MNPFEAVKEINEKKGPYPDDLKGYSQFMVNKIFSCSRDFLPLAVEANINGRFLTDRMHFDLFYHAIPKNKAFIPYNAKKAKEDEDLLLISKYFEISLQVAKDYSILLSEEEKKSIRKMYEKPKMVKETIKKGTKEDV